MKQKHFFYIATFFKDTFFVLIMSMLFVSCGPSKKQKVYLSKIDSITKKVEATASYFLQADTFRLKKQMAKIKQTINRLNSVPIKQKLKDSLFLALGHKYQIIKHFVKTYTELDKELKYSEKQLSNLHHDIKENILKNGKDSIYFSDERKAANHLRREMANYYQQLKSQTREWKQLQVYMDSVLQQK